MEKLGLESASRYEYLNKLHLSRSMDYENIENSLKHLLMMRKNIAIKVLENQNNEESKELYDYVNEKIKLLLALP